MDPPDLAERVIAKLGALDEAVAILFAYHYTAAELDGMVKDHRAKAQAVLEPPEGVTLMPAMRSQAVRDVALQWAALAELFERAHGFNLRGKAEREAVAQGQEPQA